MAVVGVVEADARARITLGIAGVQPGDRFAVKVNVDGEILLTPVALIPKKLAESPFSKPMPDHRGAFA